MRDESSATGSPGRTAAAGSRGDRYLALTNNGRIFGLPPYSIQVLTMQYAQLRAQLTPNLGGIGSNVRSMVVRSTPYGRESGRYSVQYGVWSTETTAELTHFIFDGDAPVRSVGVTLSEAKSRPGRRAFGIWHLAFRPFC